MRPDNPDIVYAGAIGSGFGNGLLWRHDHATRANRSSVYCSRAGPVVVVLSVLADAVLYRRDVT